MTTRSVGVVVVGEAVTIVLAQVPKDDGPVVILADSTWKLQAGERAPAYAVMHQRLVDYLHENKIDEVVVKASALPTGSGARLGLLTSAELRGVIIAAAASVCGVRVIAKGIVSKTYGKRKVDEYIEDDGFWDKETTGGKLRKMSREAAMFVISSRDN